MSADERLMVLLEARITDFERKFRQAEQRGTRTYQSLQRGSRGATRQMEVDMGRMGKSAAAAAASILGLGAALHKIRSSTDGFKTISNQLRSIGQDSDAAVSKLLSAAIRSRSSIEELATGVARIQKATGDGYDVTLRRVETLNKLLSVGGATAQEVSSVMIQLSQAFTSGELMGEELRALREAAPVEVLDAIAAAAGGTRGELKKLGEEGKLTNEVVTRALDSLAATADQKFEQTTQTIGQAMTNINSALTVFVGRVDEGTGASATLVAALANLSTWLTENADEAVQLGQSLGAMFDVANERVGEFLTLIDGLGDSVREAFDAEPMEDFGDGVQRVIDFIADLNGVIEGAAAVAQDAFLSIADNIADGIAAAINAVIGAVESMVNSVLAGVRRVAGVIDTMTAGAAAANNLIPEWMRPEGLRTEGTSLAAGITDVSLDRVTPGSRRSSGKSLSEVYQEARDAGAARVVDALAEANLNYGGRLAGRQIASQTPLQLGLPPAVEPAATAPAGTPAAGATSSKAGGRGRKQRSGGGAAKAESPFFEDIEQDLTNLERQISLVGKSNEEVAKARARWEMLDEAKKRGIPINAELSAQIDAQAEKFGRLTAELERAEKSQQQFEDAVDGIASAMSGALVAGESLREGLANVLQGIARDIMTSGIRNALMSQFGGGGGGFNFMSLFGGGDALTRSLRGAGLSPGFSSGGFTGFGGRMEPAGVVHRGEYVMSAAAVQRIGLHNLEAMHKGALRGYSSGGAVGSEATMTRQSGGMSRLEVSLSPELVGNILAEARRDSLKISQQTSQQHSRAAADMRYLREGR